MTEAELRGLFDEGKKIIREERRWRRIVFASKPKLRDEKIAEMDRLLQIFAMLKDECKQHMTPALEQGTLLDVPTPTKYG